MIKRSRHWRTNLVGFIAILLFVLTALAVGFGVATFEQGSAFISAVALPLMWFGFKASADSKKVDSDKYEGL